MNRLYVVYLCCCWTRSTFCHHTRKGKKDHQITHTLSHALSHALIHSHTLSHTLSDTYIKVSLETTAGKVR
jgi:hypothetical protein